MVRDVVERVIPSPTPEDLMEIRTEATDLAIKSGASPNSIEVQIEIDSQTSKVSAIAMGSTEVQATDLLKKIDVAKPKNWQLSLCGTNLKDVYEIASNDFFFVIGTKRGDKQEIRVIDKKGFIKVQRADGDAVVSTVSGVRRVTDNYLGRIGCL